MKISKHLAYLLKYGMVDSERCANMMIYRLPSRRPSVLEANLACLHDCAREEKVFRGDLVRLHKLRAGFDCATPVCVREPGASC